MLESVREHLKLENTDRADDGLIAHMRLAKDLDGTLFAELVEALVELLSAQRILELDHRKMLRAKARDLARLDRLAGGYLVADFEIIRVIEAQDIAGVGVYDERAFAGHKLLGIAKLHGAILAQKMRLHIAQIAPRGDPHKGDAVAVAGVHIRLNLEDEP